MAAGLLGMGTVVAGSSEIAGRYIAELLDKSRETGRDLEDVCRESLEGLKAERKKVPGLGHPQHNAGDPRANVLLKIADENGVSGDYIRTLRTVADLAPGIMDRPLPINVSGAIPALMLDAGWPLEAMKGIPLLARAAGLVAHLFEESQRSIGFIMSHKADLAIGYDGPMPEGRKDPKKAAS
jgi:citrate synthase